jgi:hypothetical protein
VGGADERTKAGWIVAVAGVRATNVDFGGNGLCCIVVSTW